MRSAAILREARLRAGLSQDELAKVSRKDRTVIARYEQGVVAPSLDTLVQLLRACGFDIPLELVPYDAGPDERIEEIQMLAPERRLDRMLEERRRGSRRRSGAGRVAELGAEGPRRTGSIRAGCWRRCIAIT